MKVNTNLRELLAEVSLSKSGACSRCYERFEKCLREPLRPLRWSFSREKLNRGGRSGLRRRTANGPRRLLGLLQEALRGWLLEAVGG